MAARRGVQATQIATWCKQLLEQAGEVFENGNPGADDAERRIRDLQAKVGELTMERDFSSGALGSVDDYQKPRKYGVEQIAGTGFADPFPGRRASARVANP